MARKKKRVFKKLTIQLSLWEFRDIDELRKELNKKTLSKTLIHAACNYLRLRKMLFEVQNELDYLKYENSINKKQ
jgi:hypothetical protein